MRTLVVVLGLLVGACGSDDGGGDGAPAAPEDVTVERLGGGGHVTWTDASDDEDGFTIQRKEGSGAYIDLATVEFDTTQYHDEPLTTGTTYTYMVMSVNANGEGHSAEVTYTHQ